jgi:hypothetical protein
MTLGVLFVVTLWAIAGLSLAARHARGLAVFAIVWGAVLAGFGASQQGILVGDFHWIVRIAHFAIAVSVMPMAERLGRQPA